MIREAFKITRLFVGLFFYAFGIVMTIQANVGFAPWDVFHQGLVLHFDGLTMGRANIYVGAVIILIELLLKEKVGIGTFSNMLTVGIFIDFFLNEQWIPHMQSFIPGIILLICGFFVIAMSTAVYVGAGYSAGPRDLLMVLLTKRTGKPVGFCRGCVEGLVVLTGWLLGGYAGIGTVIYVFGIGLAVQIAFTLLRFNVKTVRRETVRETFLRWCKF